MVEEHNILGPYLIEYSSRVYRCFFRSGNTRTTVRTYYGSLVFYLSSSWSYRFFRARDLSQVSVNLFTEQACRSVFTAFENETSFAERLLKRRIDLKGEPYLSQDTVYILGMKKKVVSDLSQRDSSCFFASSFESLKSLYKSLAEHNLVRRGNLIARRMNPPYVPEFGLSDAVSYLGVNNLRKHRILLNEALYAFSEEVGNSVIVHEIAHCFYPNHSKAFYELVLNYCPEYYKYERILTNGDFTNHGTDSD